ncbi:MAG: ROK family transcriptional regulator [Verrucomicrobia bacterium]|nr:ROK family transcriptional regulator [Verrucomicrobiota bacterium]
MKPRRVKAKHQIVARVEAELLKRVRARGGLSRVDLARELNLAPSTAGIYVDRLIREGFLYESEKAVRELGRPPTMLGLNPGGGRFIGVDFDARDLMAVSVDFSQKVLKQTHKTIPESDSAEQILLLIEEAIVEVLADHEHDVLGIGVGVPGASDPHRGIALDYDYIRGWRNIPLGERLGRRFGAPVHLENNIRSMALAELWFGQGLGVENFICLGVRTGIAAGIILGGHLYRGSSNLAGEIGMWPFPQTASGAAPKLEELASVRALIASLTRALQSGAASSLSLKNGAVSFDDVVRAARRGDPLVREVVEGAAQVHAAVVCQMNLLFNPQKIILAGPLTELGDAFLAPLKTTAARLDRGAKVALPEITNSTLGQFNGAMGAAALALHQWKPVRE